MRVKTGVVKELPEEVEWVKAVGWEEAQDLPSRIVAITRWYLAPHRSLTPIVAQGSGYAERDNRWVMAFAGD